jgi:CheY-like chemotaxis protein
LTLALPVAEDAETVTVASADPTSLPVERELMRLTGRTPVFVVCPPEALALRLDTLQQAPAPGHRSRRAVPAGEANGGRVLLVDDDAGSRLFARAVLEKRGYTVLEAEDGVEALHRLRHEEPVALVIADLNMPHMDGLELLWEMRGSPEWAGVPVLVLTGENDEVLEAKLIDEGADDYVCKPLEPRLFLARVKATIRRAGA